MRNLAVKCVSLALTVLPAGCQLSDSTDTQNTVSYAELAARNEGLTSQLAQQQRQTEHLQQQLTTLRGFSTDRLDRLVCVAAIELGRFTGAYDNDGNDVDEGVKVYLVLRDQQGDPIKAAGEVEIELWDLAAPPGKRDLGQWRYGLEELPQYWLSGFMAYYYKFQLPWPQTDPPQHSPLTLKLLYKDALTGAALEQQKMVTVRIPQPQD